MSKNRKGMRKEWHTKRIDYNRELFIDFMEMLIGTFNLDSFLSHEELECFYALYNTLYSHRNGVEVAESCGCFLVEYGYNWIPASDKENN